MEDPENFDFRVSADLPRGERVFMQVFVKGTLVSLRDSSGQVASGVWDAGKYVRYIRSQELPLPPQLLDEIDKELRIRLRAKGLQARASPLRRSAIGYGNG